MNTSKRIALVCFLGATVGTMIALELDKYLWWIGALIGSILSYLGYEPRHTARAIKTAWNSTLRKLSTLDRKKIKSIAETITYLMVITFLGSTWFMPIVYFGNHDNPLDKTISYLFGIIASFFIGIILGVARFCHLKNIGASDSELNDVWPYIRDTNPIAAIIYWLPKAIWFAAGYLGEYVKTVLILIYSDQKLICLVCVAIGTAIGFHFGHAIIGGISGAMFGVFSFKLISVRWLRLTPV